MFIDKREDKTTNCYTYQVNMVIQVIADDLDKANDKLEQNGGYVSKREVTLLDSNVVYDRNSDDSSTM